MSSLFETGCFFRSTVKRFAVILKQYMAWVARNNLHGRARILKSSSPEFQNEENEKRVLSAQKNILHVSTRTLHELHFIIINESRSVKPDVFFVAAVNCSAEILSIIIGSYL